MRRMVAKGLAFVGTAGLLMFGVVAEPARAVEGKSPGVLTIRFGDARLELNSPTSPADTASRETASAEDEPTMPVQHKSAAEKPAPAKALNSEPGFAEVKDSPAAAKKTGDEAKPADSTTTSPKKALPSTVAPNKAEPGKENSTKTPPDVPGVLKIAPESPARGKENSTKTPPDVPGVLKVAPESPAPARLPLSPQMAALRDRVRAVVTQHFHEALNTSDNSPGQILKFCLAFGCDTEIRYGGSAGSAMSGIGALCYGYPCAGYRLLTVADRKVMARLGYGLQESPGELLAVLAQSAVPESYEIRVGQWRGTIANLAESEQSSCQSGGDLSQKLIGLSHYLPDGASWKNARGDAWSLERMVREELNRSPATDSSDATNHLSGLAYAVERHARAGKAMDGQYARAQKFLAEYQTFAFSLQNTDGSWNPAFFAAKGGSRDVAGTLRSTGCILEWLAVSLPVERLQDRQVILSVGFVAGVVENYYAQANIVNSSTREIDGLMHALHALRVYDRRIFKPAEPAKPAQPERPAKPDTTETEAARQGDVVR